MINSKWHFIINLKLIIIVSVGSFIGCKICLRSKGMYIAKPKGLVQRTLDWPYFQVFPPATLPGIVLFQKPNPWNSGYNLIWLIPNHTKPNQTIPKQSKVKQTNLFLSFDTRSPQATTRATRGRVSKAMDPHLKLSQNLSRKVSRSLRKTLGHM